MNERTVKYFVVLLIFVIVIGIYYPVLQYDYVHYDDEEYVAENLQVKKGITPETIRWAFTTDKAGFWHPMVWLSLMVDRDIFGFNPRGFHLTNILLHTLSTALLFLLFSSMTGALWRSAFVAAIFAAHPLHVESVAWIAERKDVLSGFFWVLTMGCYAVYNEKRTCARYLLVLSMFLAGMMSKPVLITLPFVLLLMDYWPLCREKNTFHDYRMIQEKKGRAYCLNKWLVLEKVPFLIIAVMIAYAVYAAEQKIGAIATMTEFPWNVRISNALVSYARYAGKTLWPSHLSVFYPHPGLWPFISVAFSSLCIGAVSLYAFRNRHDYPFILVGWCWFLGTLVPTIGIIQLGDQAMADRYMYIPIIGLSFIISWGTYEAAARMCIRRWVIAVLGISTIIVFIVTARVQLGHWKDAETLFRHSLEVTEDNYLAYNNLGAALLGEGNYHDALHNFNEALRIRPLYPDVYFNLALLAEEEENLEGAVQYYGIAIDMKPKFPEAYNNLGIVYAKDGKIVKAIHYFKKAIEIDGTYEVALRNLQIALDEQRVNDIQKKKIN